VNSLFLSAFEGTVARDGLPSKTFVRLFLVKTQCRAPLLNLLSRASKRYDSRCKMARLGLDFTLRAHDNLLIKAIVGVNFADCHKANGRNADCHWEAKCNRPDSSAVYCRNAVVCGKGNNGSWQSAVALYFYFFPSRSLHVYIV
jgi:hypothetical protein